MTGKIIISNSTSEGTPASGKTEIRVDSTTKKLVSVDDAGLETAYGGETNTSSNVGVAGVGVFKQKTGADFEFKKINAGSSKVTITDDTGNSEIDIDVVDANIDHDALTNFVENSHIDHTAVTLTAGDGLAGGGDISASRTFDIDISPQADIGTPDSGDFLLVEDITDGSIKKVQVGNLPASGGASSLNDLTDVDLTGLTNTQILQYNSTSGNFEPANAADDHTPYGEATGVLTGGVLSTGAGATEFSISDGTGQIVSSLGVVTAVSWSGKTNITPTNIGTQNITFVGIDSAGNVVESSTRFTNTQSRTIIVLGVAVHVDRVNVDVVNNAQQVAYNTGAQLFDLYSGLGFFNISGNVFTPNGANLNLDKSVGVMGAHGANYFNDGDNPNALTLAVLTALTFQYRYSDGSNDTTGTVLDVDNLDNGAGGKTALANNKWSIQRIYSFTSNNVKIQRGVEEFASSEIALASIASEAYVTEPSIAANGLLRGYIIAKKGSTDLSDPTQANFLQAGKFQDVAIGGGGGVASSLQSSYENSTVNPEILTDDTGGGVAIRRGSTGGDTDVIFEGQNGAGTQTFSVTGAGDISGNNLSGTNTGDTGNRARANHTGTQTASTISDFDTEVSNNTQVTANTAKVSADGSIGTHSDVDLTGLANLDILSYNSTSGNFEPITNTGGGGTTFSDAVFEVYDNVDTSKIAKFQASGITTSTTKTFTFQDKDHVIADKADHLLFTSASQTVTGDFEVTGALTTNGYPVVADPIPLTTSTAIQTDDFILWWDTTASVFKKVGKDDVAGSFGFEVNNQYDIAFGAADNSIDSDGLFQYNPTAKKIYLDAASAGIAGVLNLVIDGNTYDGIVLRAKSGGTHTGNFVDFQTNDGTSKFIIDSAGSIKADAVVGTSLPTDYMFFQDVSAGNEWKKIEIDGMLAAIGGGGRDAADVGEIVYANGTGGTSSESNFVYEDATNKLYLSDAAAVNTDGQFNIEVDSANDGISIVSQATYTSKYFRARDNALTDLFYVTDTGGGYFADDLNVGDSSLTEGKLNVYTGVNFDGHAEVIVGQADAAKGEIRLKGQTAGSDLSFTVQQTDDVDNTAMVWFGTFPAGVYGPTGTCGMVSDSNGTGVTEDLVFISRDVPTTTAVPQIAIKANTNFVGINKLVPTVALDVVGAGSFTDVVDVIQSTGSIHYRLTKTDGAFSNPFTSDTYGSASTLGFMNAGSNDGGFDIGGFSDADQYGVDIRGHIGSASPSSNTSAVILGGYKLSGSSSTALTGTDLILALRKDATTSNMVTFDASGNGVFVGDVSVEDEVYGVGWDGSVEVPTKNALYDKFDGLNAELDHDALLNFTATEHFTQASITTVGTVTTGNVDAVVSAASTTLAGKVELTTTAEVDTGTDTTRAITADALAGSYAATKTVQITCFDYTVDTATGDGKGYVHIPESLDGMDLVAVHAKVITAGTTGTTDIQIHNVNDVTDMLGTKLTIDSGETGSDTALIAATINPSFKNVSDNELLRIDIDAVSTTAAKGLIVTLEFRLP